MNKMRGVTSEEIAKFRAQAVDYPAACAALDEIENCEGDLEDASIVLALRAGQEPSTSEDWLMGLAKRYRHLICTENLRSCLRQNELTGAIAYLTNETACPDLLVAPILIYVLQNGIDTFCQPIDQGMVAPHH